MAYYTKLKRLWYELDDYSEAMDCTCDAAGQQAKEEEEVEKLLSVSNGLASMRFTVRFSGFRISGLGLVGFGLLTSWVVLLTPLPAAMAGTARENFRRQSSGQDYSAVPRSTSAKYRQLLTLFNNKNESTKRLSGGYYDLGVPKTRGGMSGLWRDEMGRIIEVFLILHNPVWINFIKGWDGMGRKIPSITADCIGRSMIWTVHLLDEEEIERRGDGGFRLSARGVEVVPGDRSRGKILICPVRART
ncbi:hypothetical protein CRG98_019493 [Punica granatum]|uniref:Uncharacterized protein n=1 Tax=Punica granatum TaxID=22663 RepID=A0A2I0JUZ6_PUNGR|nr:hypothetical protein CRG98_019493 [Punica granatum]